MEKKGTWKLSQQYRKSIWPLQMYQHWPLSPRWHHEHQIIEKWVGTLPPHPKFCLPFELNWLNSLFCLWVPVYQLLLTSVFLLSRVYEMEENKHSELYSLFFFSFCPYFIISRQQVWSCIQSEANTRWVFIPITEHIWNTHLLPQNTFSHTTVRK